MSASIPDARPAAAAEENRFLGIQHSLASTRHTIRPHWQADTRRLVRKNETGAYHHAQRFAARARDADRSRELAYWAKVARGSAARKRSRDHAGHRRRGDPAGRQDIAASRRAAVQQGPSAGNAATGPCRDSSFGRGADQWKQPNSALLGCLLVRFRIFHDQPAAGSATQSVPPLRLRLRGDRDRSPPLWGAIERELARSRWSLTPCRTTSISPRTPPSSSPAP